MKLCDYSCGQEAKYQFKNGKWCCEKFYQKCSSLRKINSKRNKGRKKLYLLGDNNPSKRLEVRKKLSKKLKDYNNKPEVKERMIKDNPAKRLEVRKKLSRRMLNGGSSYANSFNKNPSKQELQLREVVDRVCRDLPMEHKSQYKVLNYSIDIALPEYKIAIEYDGYYHFDCQEDINYHKKRQQEIEDLGWKFIRYNIFQKFPTKEQVKEDVEKVRRV